MSKNEERSVNLLDEAPVIVWLTDADGDCTFLNHKWYDLTGQTPEVALGTGWLSAVHPDDRAFSFTAFQNASEKREAFRFEYRLRSKEGIYRWAIDSGSPRSGPKGEFCGFIGTVIDIHDRKAAEEKLQRSEERYRYLFESIDEAFAVVEMIFDEEQRPVDHRFLEVNPSFEEQTGMMQPVGKTARQLVPDLNVSWFEVFGQVAMTGKPIRVEDHDAALNRWFDVFAFRVDRPEQCRVALLFNDISERKIREQNAIFLAEISEELAKAPNPQEVIAAVGEKLCRHLRVGSTAFVKIDDIANSATVFHERREDAQLPSLIGVHDLTKFMSESFLAELRGGRTVAVADVATEPGMEEMAPAYEALGVRSHIQGSYRSDGRWRFMISVHHHEPRQWSASEIEVIRELTALVWLRLERAQAEQSLRESERQARAFFEGSGVGAAQVGTDLRFRKVNDRLCQITGYSREELLQMTLLDLDHPDEIEADRKGLEQAAQHDSPYDVEKRYLCKNGEPMWVHMNVRFVRDTGGTPLYSAAIIQDITDRKRAEAALRESERNLRELSRSLERRVAERTAELQDQTLRLRHLAAELGSAEQRERKRLAALLHDDLQQLLVAASMHLNNASRRLTEERPRQAVEQAARWIGEAINAARDLTRQLRPPVLYEDGLVAALHGLASEMAARHHLKVRIDGGEAIEPVDDDLNALLFDSVRELLFNVAKYAEVDTALIRVSGEGERLRVMVEDHGKGFDVHAAAISRTRSGFGLFSIQERLAARGGTVSIRSRPGEGTRVVLELPLDEAGVDLQDEALPLEHAPAAPRAAKGADRCISVLVADDHALVRQGLATMLAEDQRMKVVAEAPDGLEAVQAVDHHRPNVILVDINMPRMNGIEAAREIHRRWPGTIIIGLSVQDDDATAKAMLDAGASAFLSKAGDSDRMISTIVKLVEEKVKVESNGDRARYA